MVKILLILIVTFFLTHKLNSTEIYGKPKLIDGDTVELSNLTRQVLFNLEDVGEFKTIAAKKRILERNPDVSIKPITKLY